ncbi:MAG: hypothetical protein KF819_18340 [Labilithrix sp.]|nr:hypothetical protein [Labilithrix sp.]
MLTLGAKDKNDKSVGGSDHQHGRRRRGALEVDGSESQDRHARFVLFQQIESLEEYVLVSQAERRIAVRRRAGRSWTFEVKLTGEAYRVHGHDIAVDAISA